jgi:hypothetical protein
LLLAEPETSSKEQVSSDQQPVARGQRSENREPQNIEYRMLNIEGKKTSSFEIPCSIFDIQNRENCWATGFLLLAPGSHRGLPFSPVFICHLTSVICLRLG